MNQGKLGAKAGIDTAEVQYWEMREVAGLQSTHVDFKNGITVILRGAAKVAFDKWAATLPMAGEARRLVDTEPRYGTGMAEPTGLAQGQGVPESPTLPESPTP